MTRDQEAQLPKYAQRELHRLRDDLRNAQAAVAAVFGNPEGARVVVDPNSDTPLPLPGGDRALVEFRLTVDADERREQRVEDGKRRPDYFQVRFASDSPDELYVSGYKSGSALAVVPHASNAVRIRWVPW